MNADEKLREILLAEAESVDPGAEGWDRIRAGVDARRRRTAWLRGGLAAATVLSLLAVAIVVRPDGRDAALDPTATPTPTEAAAPVAATPLDTVWPFTDTAALDAWAVDHGALTFLADPVETARQFGLRYLGMPNAAATRLDDNRVELTRTAEGGEKARVTVVTLRQEREAWLVVRADKGEAVQIATPAAGAVVTSPLAASGPYREPDPVFEVALLGTPDGVGNPPPLADAQAGTAPPQDWSATLTFEPPQSIAGSLLVTFGSNLDSGLGGAVAIPVRFAGSAASTPPGAPEPATFVGIDEQSQLAVFSSTTGRPISYLTAEQPGGGVTDASITDDGRTVVYAQGAGTCAAGIWSVPAGGGEPTNFFPAAKGAAGGPVLTNDGLLLHSVVRCGPGGDQAEISLWDVERQAGRTVPVRGRVSGRVSVRSSGRLAAYLGVDGARTEVRYLDVSEPAPTELSLVSPSGCAWTAVTMADDNQIYAAAACDQKFEVLRLSLDGGDHESVLRLSERIVALDFDVSGDHLLLETKQGEESHVWRWHGGSLVELPPSTGSARSPTW